VRTDIKRGREVSTQRLLSRQEPGNQGAAETALKGMEQPVKRPAGNDGERRASGRKRRRGTVR